MDPKQSYEERKKLVLKWKSAESKITADGNVNFFGKEYISELLTPEEMAGMLIDWKWNNALSDVSNTLASRDYYPQTKEYWESVRSFVVNSFQGIYLCRRCKKETRLNIFRQICDYCSDEESKYVRLGDFGKLVELSNKEKEQLYSPIKKSTNDRKNMVKDDIYPF